MPSVLLKSNILKLKRLYHHELQEYELFNRRATLKSLLFAIPLLLLSIVLATFDTTNHQIIPWHIISGITSLYFITTAITHRVNSYNASNRTNAEVDLYLMKIEKSKLIAYQLSDETIECYKDNELEYFIKWIELKSLVEKESYFYLTFNNGKSILIPEYAVETKFYNEFVNQAKKNIRHSGQNHFFKKHNSIVGMNTIS